ncbi:MAG: DUF4159 domain-containing protein [Rhodospirillaceae bacterium]|nr:DUF4159 domain-containing protein [Rhodospirillales bacterium]MBT4701640.1 DUF4159 domain-containing protein [Rhodospirillaceae bacterium]MBT5033294.1 DUF4159 domain-containing protein [Rhodospirillaceae bacterium]MBT6360733.1 DUF4159 domain-containing protein [Rhodospirillaceae bacterium]
MLALGSFSFVVPWALAGLAAIPIIWWILRVTPPAPRRVAFPPVRLLLRILNREESAAKAPWWLLLLRLLLVVCVILGAAHPLLNAADELQGDGPLILVVDDGWAAAANWKGRQNMMMGLVDQAERSARPVIILTTAPDGTKSGESTLHMLQAVEARRFVQSLQPKPWPTGRKAVLKTLVQNEALKQGKPGHVVWLSDGLAGPSTDAFVQVLGQLGKVTVVRDSADFVPVVLRPPVSKGTGLNLTAVRPMSEGTATFSLRAFGQDGRALAREPLIFADGKQTANVHLDLPPELRNRLARFDIEAQTTAASHVLVDERWRRRPVGILDREAGLSDQPLLSGHYYLRRALNPFTEVRTGTTEKLLARQLAVLVLDDPGLIGPAERRKISAWIERGGVLVRFAGPRLSQDKDTLLPVKLRQGDRILGGALSWQKPAALAPFGVNSPFNGLAIPKDVRVRRQVLAQPSLDLPEKTWARLADGTPLVTAEKRKRGWIVLVHTMANTGWSNLPLSGLFVDMLRRLVTLSQGVVSKPGGPPLAPVLVMDGFGRLGSPTADVTAIAGAEFAKTVPSPKHPPGFYGEEAERRALNLSAQMSNPKPLDVEAEGVREDVYGDRHEVDLRPWLLGAALILAVIDLAISLALRGLLTVSSATAVFVALVLSSHPSWAQSSESFAKKASLKTSIAYIKSGLKQVDSTSRSGLSMLSLIVERRTAAELGEPIAIDPATDDLSFFPLIYWPVTGRHATPSKAAVLQLNEYLRSGGTILFDTRDHQTGREAETMRRLALVLDIPPVQPVPVNHVLTRSFYLMREFPGRITGGRIWIERAGARINDGVSSVVVGNHDWAAAWAVDESQQPLFPVIPGGERQRELAFRFGINLVMYVLTGNYKSDQVHAPAILERLGQ